MKDNYSLWEEHDYEQGRWLRSRPKCDWCKEHIQDDELYDFGGEIICEECIDEYLDKNYKVKTEKYVR